MSDPRPQATPTGGPAPVDRERAIFDQGEIGPWRGRVRITPINLRSRWGERQFEVLAEWHGPGLVGLPPVDGGVDASDTYVAADGELARAIAARAVEVLRRGNPIETPDLRAIAQRLRP